MTVTVGLVQYFVNLFLVFENNTRGTDF